MADAVGESQISHGSRPPVAGRNLAPINGCRSSECGGEEESRHIYMYMAFEIARAGRFKEV